MPANACAKGTAVLSNNLISLLVILEQLGCVRVCVHLCVRVHEMQLLTPLPPHTLLVHLWIFLGGDICRLDAVREAEKCRITQSRAVPP